MNLIRRHVALTFAVLLTLLLAAAQYRSGLGARLAEPPALHVPTSIPAAAFKVETKGSLILVAKMIKQPAEQYEVRGARLRDKGEALGGGAMDRVDKATETLSAQ